MTDDQYNEIKRRQSNADANMRAITRHGIKASYIETTGDIYLTLYDEYEPEIKIHNAYLTEDGLQIPIAGADSPFKEATSFNISTENLRYLAALTTAFAAGLAKGTKETYESITKPTNPPNS